MKQSLAVVTCFISSALVNGQTTFPSFEVASVKRAAQDQMSALPLPPGVEEQIRVRKEPGRITYSGATLKLLLAQAYDMKSSQISGPGWLDTERYDVVATMPLGTDLERSRLMLQRLLVERFQIRAHRETKVTSVYRLTVAKSGSKLQSAEDPPQYKDEEEAKAARTANVIKRLEERFARMRSGERVYGRSTGSARSTVARLAEVLSSNLDRPVVDRTELKGLYSYNLQWDPPRPVPADPGPVPISDRPQTSIFAAVEEQLGLRLEPVKEQVELLIIDGADKVPVSN